MKIAESNREIKKDIFEYCCPDCRNILRRDGQQYFCEQCSSHWPIVNDIPNFLGHSYYWSHIPRDKMEHMNRTALKKGWETALRENMKKHIVDFIIDESRVDFRFFCNINSNDRVLDIGCGWGTFCFVLSRFCKEVIGIDATMEQLQFMDIKRSQLGINNIRSVSADCKKIPLPDDSINLAVMNGVLEWVGDDQGWAGAHERSSDSEANLSASPALLQIKALKEAYRVLKKEGKLFLGIENRFAYEYFRGVKDEHVGLKYISLMPRWLANIYMRRVMGRNYRVYTYSYGQYKRLLKKAGYRNIKFYWMFPSYRNPRVIVPLENKRMLIFYVKRYLMFNWPYPIRLLIKFLLRLGAGKYLCPCYGIFAQK